MVDIIKEHIYPLGIPVYTLILFWDAQMCNIIMIIWYHIEGHEMLIIVPNA